MSQVYILSRNFSYDLYTRSSTRTYTHNKQGPRINHSISPNKEILILYFQAITRLLLKVNILQCSKF